MEFNRVNDHDLHIRWKRGQGHGGQHRNKTENCCVLTHTPTGLTVTVDGRSREQNLKNAKRLMKTKLHHRRAFAERVRKDAERLAKIRPGGVKRVRTYDYSTGVVTDHRTGKRASLKDVLEKGKLEKLK